MLEEMETTNDDSIHVDLGVSNEAGVLSEQTLIELGFEKEPDAMYYERGWENKNINIYFSERKITQTDFWEHILRTVEIRGEIIMKQKLKNLLEI